MYSKDGKVVELKEGWRQHWKGLLQWSYPKGSNKCEQLELAVWNKSYFIGQNDILSQEFFLQYLIICLISQGIKVHMGKVVYQTGLVQWIEQNKEESYKLSVPVSDI